MPYCLCRPRAVLRRMVLPPLQFAARPYQAWRQRQWLAVARDDERRRLAEVTDAELATRHAELWERFPAAATAVRTWVRNTTPSPQEDQHHGESPRR